jgi:hypothetical protein
MTLQFVIKNQLLGMVKQHIVADTIQYFDAEFDFQTDDWDGLNKYAHFAPVSGGTPYDYLLVDDEIPSSAGMVLSAGDWYVYVHGTDGTTRITSNRCRFRVEASGILEGESPPEIELTFGEQLLAAAFQSLYELAVANGYEGTAEQWLASLRQVTTESTTDINGLIKGVGGLIAQAIAGTDYLTPADIIDTLVSTSTTDALSAKQGKALQDAKSALPAVQLLTGYVIASSAGLPAATDTINAAIGKLAKQLTPVGLLKSDGTLVSAATPSTDYLNRDNIINDLVSTWTSKALSANMGKSLQDSKSALPAAQVLTGYAIAGSPALPAASDTINQAIGKLAKNLAAVGLLKSNGTAVSAAVPGTDYLSPSTALYKCRNLLHNGDFRNPVDQRGGSPYSTADGYTIDRWKLTVIGGTLTKAAGSITIVGVATGEGVYQFIEDYSKYDGLPLCVSCNIGGMIYQASGMFTADAAETVATVSLGTNKALILTSASGLLSVSFFFSGAATIADLRSVKLEVGTYSTLTDYDTEEYAAQLAICQRYAKAIAGNSRTRAYQVSANYIDFIYALPVTMRTAPQTIESPLDFTVYTLAGAAQTGFTYSVLNLGPSLFGVRATKTSHGLADAYISASTAGMISADM